MSETMFLVLAACALLFVALPLIFDGVGTTVGVAVGVAVLFYYNSAPFNPPPDLDLVHVGRTSFNVPPDLDLVCVGRTAVGTAAPEVDAACTRRYDAQMQALATDMARQDQRRRDDFARYLQARAEDRAAAEAWLIKKYPPEPALH